MYRTAAAAALVMVGLVLLDMGISMALPAGDMSPADLTAAVAIVGGGIYVANNTALPMLALSRDYAAATHAQRITIEAAGTALLARGADFTTGSLIGTLLPSVGSLLMAFVILTGQVFKKAVGYIGMIAYLSLTVFTIMTVCWPESFRIAMLIAVPGGLLVLVWNIILMRKFITLSKV